MLTKLEDPFWGFRLCGDCAINYAQQTQAEVNRYGWKHRGGEKAQQEFYKAYPDHVAEYRRTDKMRLAKLQLYNDFAGANNRTCTVINYFKCPYGKERSDLRKDGYLARELWRIVEWYDDHWNGHHYIIPSESEKKWYHQGEPSIIDVTNLQDILKACEDGRINKIKNEYERYKKEINR